MTRGWRSALSACIFFAFTAPFGIAAHLTSELVGLGWQDDADVLFSARHGYLAIVALAALATFAIVLRSIPATNRRRRVSEIVEALPFKGRGASFITLSFGLQFGFFAITQIGEGCPLCAGDVFMGIVTAAAAALIGALIITFAKERVLELVIGLVWYGSPRLWTPPVPNFSPREQHAADASAVRRSPLSFRYRPPPIAARSKPAAAPPRSIAPRSQIHSCCISERTQCSIQSCAAFASRSLPLPSASHPSPPRTP